MKKINLLILAGITVLVSCASLTTNYWAETGRCIVLKTNPSVLIAIDNKKSETKEILTLKIGDTLKYMGLLKKINFGKSATYSYLINIDGKNYFIEDEDVYSIERGAIRSKLYNAEFPKEKADEYWSKAIAFVMDNSEMKIQTQTDYLLQTFNPLKENQRGWTLQKIINGDKVEIKAVCNVKIGSYSFDSGRQEKRLNWYLNTGEKKSETDILMLDS